MVNDLIIETNELTKSYGPHVALDKLNLQVQRGATGLLGPNGAGKSTFFKTIHTLHKYSKAIHPTQAREDAEYYENTFNASIHIESYIL